MTAPVPEPAGARPATPPRHTHTATPAVAASGSIFVALFVLALSLRPQLSAIGPLVPEILVEFGPESRRVPDAASDGGKRDAFVKLVAALDPLVGPLDQRSVLPVPLPGGTPALASPAASGAPAPSGAAASAAP